MGIQALRADGSKVCTDPTLCQEYGNRLSNAKQITLIYEAMQLAQKQPTPRPQWVPKQQMEFSVKINPFTQPPLLRKYDLPLFLIRQLQFSTCQILLKNATRTLSLELETLNLSSLSQEYTYGAFLETFQSTRISIPVESEQFDCSKYSANLFFKGATLKADFTHNPIDFSGIYVCRLIFKDAFTSEELANQIDLNTPILSEREQLSGQYFAEVGFIMNNFTEPVQAIVNFDSYEVQELGRVRKRLEFYLEAGYKQYTGLAITELYEWRSILPWEIISLFKPMKPEYLAQFEEKRQLMGINSNENFVLQFLVQQQSFKVVRFSDSILTCLSQIGGLFALYKIFSVLRIFNQRQFENSVGKSINASREIEDESKKGSFALNNSRTEKQEPLLDDDLSKMSTYKEVFTYQNFAMLIHDNTIFKQRIKEMEEEIELLKDKKQN